MKNLFPSAVRPDSIGGRSRARQTVSALGLVTILAGVPASAGPGGEMDVTFGDHGRVLLSDPRFDERAGIAIFPEAGGSRFIAVTSGYSADALLRFNADGSLDQTFGDRGEVVLNFGSDDVQIFDVRQYAGGRILVAGAMNVYGTPDNVVHGTAILARMLADGMPDMTFGSNGRAAFGFGGVYESLDKVLLQPDGRIAVFGSTDRNGYPERVLARYSNDGRVDDSFGTGPKPGASVIDIGGIDETLADVVLLADGRFVACGSGTTQTGSGSKAVAIRLQSDGEVDVTFADNGAAVIDGGQASLEVRGCLALADGHLLMAGARVSAGTSHAVVIRLTPDGALDSGFGQNGIATLPIDFSSAVAFLRVLADGSLAAVGQQTIPGTGLASPVTYLFVARMNPATGIIDSSFGDRGATALDLGSGYAMSNAAPASLVQAPDGKLLVIGAQVYRHDWYYWPNIAVASIDTYGSGSNGWAGIATSVASIPAGGEFAELRLRRTGGSTGTLSVDFRTVDGSAVAGRDYAASSGTVTWADGDASDRILTVRGLKNPAATGYSHFDVELLNSSGGLATSKALVGISVSAAPGGGGAQGPGGTSGGGGAFGVGLCLLLAAMLLNGARSRGCDKSG